MDEKIIKLLDENPEEGMGLLMEQYMGFLWSACRIHLSNPEDIRECVQEAFLDFYEHRSRFRPEKGTVKAYLYVIAQRKAMRKAKENGHFAAELLDEQLSDTQQETDLVLNRVLLDEALSKLQEQDSRMIRMRYYGGMTCAQIARAMNLSVETVKKRQQRSLKKLRKILVALAALGVLSMAVYGASKNRSMLRFSPSTGFQETPGDSWLEMAGEPFPFDTEQGEVTVTGLLWEEGELTLSLELQNRELYREDHPGEASIQQEVLLFREDSGRTEKSSAYRMYLEDDLSRPLHVELTFRDSVPSGSQYTFRFFGAEQTIPMEEIGSYRDFSEIGAARTHKGRTIVVNGQWEGTALSLDAYTHSEDLWDIAYFYHGDFRKDPVFPGAGFHAEAEADPDKPYTVRFSKPVLCSFGEEPVVKIPVPKDDKAVDILFSVGEDTYCIYRVERRKASEYETWWKDSGMDELCIYIRPVRLEPGTVLYRFDAELGQMTAYSRGEEFSPWGSNLMDRMWGPVIRLRLAEECESAMLRINHVYKIWDQDFVITFPASSQSNQGETNFFNKFLDDSSF